PSGTTSGGRSLTLTRSTWWATGRRTWAASPGRAGCSWTPPPRTVAPRAHDSLPAAGYNRRRVPERFRGTGSTGHFRRDVGHEEATGGGRPGGGGHAHGGGDRRHPRPDQEAGQARHDRADPEQGRQVPLQRPRRGRQVPGRVRRRARDGEGSPGG